MAQTVGIQDYSRTFIQAGVELAKLSGAIGGGKSMPPVDAVGFGYLNISVSGNGNTGFISIQIDFATDPGFTNIVSIQGFTIGPGSFTSFQYPVLARYFEVSELPRDGVGTDTPLVEIFATNVYAPNLRAAQAFGPLISANQSVAAGATLTVMAFSTFEGPATIQFANDANNKWFGVVEWWNSGTASWQRFIFKFGADHGQGFSGQINLPPSVVRMSITNQDAVAHGMYLEMVV
jgi:hypothetical protein